MGERPILFTAPMVRAILEGRKTVTRRMVKFNIAGRVGRLSRQWHIEHPGVVECCPYGQPGDQLWVRETWAVQRSEPCLPHERDWQELGLPTIRYVADGATRRFQGNRSTGKGIYKGWVEKNRPSIHMPRWASRITLEITSVRVERLQDISDADAVAEGCGVTAEAVGIPLTSPHGETIPRAMFRDLWESINGAGSWAENPCVWVVEFRRIEQEAKAA